MIKKLPLKSIFDMTDEELQSLTEYSSITRNDEDNIQIKLKRNGYNFYLYKDDRIRDMYYHFNTNIDKMEGKDIFIIRTLIKYQDDYLEQKNNKEHALNLIFIFLAVIILLGLFFFCNMYQIGLICLVIVSLVFICELFIKPLSIIWKTRNLK